MDQISDEQIVGLWTAHTSHLFTEINVLLPMVVKRVRPINAAILFQASMQNKSNRLCTVYFTSNVPVRSVFKNRKPRNPVNRIHFCYMQT